MSNAILQTMDKKRRGIGDIRVVKLRREPTEGLGISITGGKEHGVPILISEIHANLPAERCNQLFVGDAILSVNGINLRDAKHNDAVNVLSRQVINSLSSCSQMIRSGYVDVIDRLER